MSFYGYQNEAQMREHNPDVAAAIIRAAQSSETICCSPGKGCVGSFDGKTFLYADGSCDTGVLTVRHHATVGGNRYAW